MDKLKIKIKNKTYNVTVAITDEEREKGLQGVTSLSEDEGMLFVFNDTEEVSIWMKNTKIPLDIIFVDEELTVKSVWQGIPNSEELMTEYDVAFVLELNAGSGIKIGDEIEFSPNKQMKSDKMLVLNENGAPQMELEGGERIFSRPNTKTLIKFAKKAAATGKDSDYKALGKRVFKFLQAQDENEPEYVNKKET